eukprot:COSAG01_NODE_70981_length_257_cov_0.658228_1_plen_64_part_10
MRWLLLLETQHQHKAEPPPKSCRQHAMNPLTGLRSLIDRPSGEEILPTPPASAPPRRIHATLAS